MKITIVHNAGFIEEEFSIEMKGGEISAEYETNDGERYVIARVPKGLVNVIYNMQKGLHKNDTIIVETETYMESKSGRNVMEAAVKMAERLLICKSTYLKDNPNKMLG